MNLFNEDPNNDECGDEEVRPGARDTQVQLVISLALGLSAFLAFCTLRPRWKSLYAARKRHSDPALGLPSLPDSFFGWMPALYKITDEQVLSSAGLDAYVFLAFFKMSMKLFAIMFVFAAVVLAPINRRFADEHAPDVNATQSFPFNNQATYHTYEHLRFLNDTNPPDREPDNSFNRSMGYLWSYLVFTYLFTGLTLYFMNRDTLKVIRVRQDYLGTQSTITDRTFRLQRIPKDLRTEEAIKQLVEKLEIGKVESVSLCRNWKELDDLMEQRQKILSKLEETWSVYLAAHKPLEATEGQPNGDNGTPDAADEEAAESDRLLRGDQAGSVERPRPQTRFWYGFLRLQSRKTDAIDYYTEKLRQLDDKILAARKKNYEPADLAFVTMDSIAACQMAIQALIDPRPDRLLTRPAPAPSDIVWRNTYAPWLNRRIRFWAITIFVAALSVIWLVPVASFASLLSICTINTVLPSFGDWLKHHEIARTLVQTGLPTLVISLLNLAVPYLYDYLSYRQGFLSQGDIFLSNISKNFFFTFFNIFLIFTVFGAVSSIFDVLRTSLEDTTYIAYTLAREIDRLSVFYTNFIMLQGLGLFPFRLVEFGSIALYPINRMGAKTPRDFAELVQPPKFYYGFYLPTALLVFILCLVYSALPGGWLVLGLGLAYFTLGYYTYKYQLLYAMDQPQHATGAAWRMICYRIVLGLSVFQLTMSGYLALKKAFTVALLVVPLFIWTLWYGWRFKGRVDPLTRFISLRSIKRAEAEDEGGGEGGSGVFVEGDAEGDMGRAQRERLRRGSTVDEDREKGLRFVNPNLVVPLEQPWIYQDPPPAQVSFEANDGASTPGSHQSGNSGGPGYATPPRNEGNSRASSNSSSVLSLGDTHIWRE
ncbi:Calcium permeable stress-gated cation channel 1 [Madurella fahalii]|uniref:Calcium permeable stress-gated cation channel 1 n=1 Tax=Madurella fahalii TaxID=1157608 RepID=A0ABQ0FYV1_9PEZI